MTRVPQLRQRVVGGGGDGVVTVVVGSEPQIIPVGGVDG